MTSDEFALRLTGECAVSPGEHVLAAVSGGADSVALLCFLCEVKEQLDLTVSCVHVEHGIRGEASLRDMRFVGALCERKGIALHTVQVDAPSAARLRGGGLEEAARALRREALLRVADQTGAQHIALAHHAMDQAETVLLHAARGSDVRGLCAMRWRNGRFIRPLLNCMPGELREALARWNQDFCEDATNGDVRFARNRIRLQVIPALEAAYPGAVSALCRLAAAAQRDEEHFERAIAPLLRSESLRLVDGMALCRRTLFDLDEALLSRVLVRRMEEAGFGAQDARTVSRLVRAVYEGKNAGINLADGAYAHVSARFVCLNRPRERLPDTPLQVPGGTDTPFGTFWVREAKPGETGDGRTAQVMPEALARGAVVTQRRPGDVMTPFGRKSPAPLKKLLIDAGIERPFRASLPVLRQGDAILFVGGLRPSESCRVRQGERAVLVQWSEGQKMRNFLSGGSENGR